MGQAGYTGSGAQDALARGHRPIRKLHPLPLVAVRRQRDGGPSENVSVGIKSQAAVPSASEVGGVVQAAGDVAEPVWREVGPP